MTNSATIPNAPLRAMDPAPGPAQPEGEAPVTMVLDRRVRPGHAEAFEAALERLVAAAARQPGYLGATVERPSAPARDYRVVVFFDRETRRAAWMRCPERKRLLRDLDAHVAGRTDVAVTGGRQAWLTRPPAEGDAPRYKLAVVRWLAIFPLVTGVSWATEPVLGGLPLPVQTMVLSGLLVTLSTWLIMPQMMRLFRGWLFAGRLR